MSNVTATASINIMNMDTGESMEFASIDEAIAAIEADANAVTGMDPESARDVLESLRKVRAEMVDAMCMPYGAKPQADSNVREFPSRPIPRQASKPAPMTMREASEQYLMDMLDGLEVLGKTIQDRSLPDTFYAVAGALAVSRCQTASLAFIDKLEAATK